MMFKFRNEKKGLCSVANFKDMLGRPATRCFLSNDDFAFSCNTVAQIQLKDRILKSMITFAPFDYPAKEITKEV